MGVVGVGVVVFGVGVGRVGIVGVGRAGVFGAGRAGVGGVERVGVFGVERVGVGYGRLLVKTYVPRLHVGERLNFPCV